MKHEDAAEDKKMFKGMLKKAVSKVGKSSKVASHLKKDIKEQKKGIVEDKKLMKTVKGKKY